MSRTLHLAEQLISLPSITPDDAGCLEVLAARLAPLGFVCERIDSGPDNFRVSNLWARRPGAGANLCRAGSSHSGVGMWRGRIVALQTLAKNIPKTQERRKHS